MNARLWQACRWRSTGRAVHGAWSRRNKLGVPRGSGRGGKPPAPDLAAAVRGGGRNRAAGQGPRIYRNRGFRVQPRNCGAELAQGGLGPGSAGTRISMKDQLKAAASRHYFQEGKGVSAANQLYRHARRKGETTGDCRLIWAGFAISAGSGLFQRQWRASPALTQP